MPDEPIIDTGRTTPGATAATTDHTGSDGPGNSIADRVAALPRGGRLLLGVVGIALALFVIMLGLGSIETDPAPTSVPSTLLPRGATFPVRATVQSSPPP